MCELGAPWVSNTTEAARLRGNASRNGIGSGVALAVALADAPGDLLGRGVTLAEGVRVGVVVAEGSTNGLRLGAADGSGTTEAERSTKLTGITAVLLSPSAPDTESCSKTVLDSDAASGPAEKPSGNRGKPKEPAGPTKSCTTPSTRPLNVEMLS